MSEELSDCVKRFLKYVSIETTSNPSSTTTPSSKCQFDLAKVLAEELKDIGMKEVELDEEHCIVFATLPANAGGDIPTLGFISHMDTSPDAPGKDIKPRIHKNYDGESDIIINEELGVILEVRNNPPLKGYKGLDIITTDGTTLLGADDKAGIAAIVSAMKYIIEQGDQLKHGKVRVAFTPDEEIGRGTDFFDVSKFGAVFGYTVDGSSIGEIEYETFNAASAKIIVTGRNVHPGYAKNKMCNALNVAIEFQNMLPLMDRPEHTEKKEGYFHLMSMTGNIDKVEMKYIIRDHSKEIFEWRKEQMLRIGSELTKRHSSVGGGVKVELKDSYKNMAEKILPVYDPVVSVAIKSMEQLGIKPLVRPIRGGTDGARLSFMGLPCPNLFTGGHNFHSKLEYAVVQGIEQAKDVVVQIIKNYVENI